MSADYTTEEQAEIVGDAIHHLSSAIYALSCLDGDLADLAHFDAEVALEQARRVQSDLAMAMES